jgi:lactose/L-arabinose transport system substrate-binding protein
MVQKSINYLLALILIILALLSACAPRNTPSITAAPLETAAPLDISGTLTVWCWQAAWEDSIVKSGALEAFMAAYPNMEIEYVATTPQDMYQQLPLALAAGTGAPDIACVENSYLPQLVEAGGLADLTDHLQVYLDKMNTFKWADAEKGGRYYAMPWDSGPVVMYYRQDIFKAVGLPSDPKKVSGLVATWDDYRKICKSIKKNTSSDCFANSKTNNSGRLYEMMLWQQGLGYYNSSGEVTVDSPENIATLDMMYSFWYAGVVSDQLEWTDGWYAEISSTDKPVATVIESAGMGELLKSWIAPETEGLWGVVQMPAMAADQVRSANVGGSYIVIPEQSQNQDAAWALVEWLFGRTDSQVAIYKANDNFPSLELAYGDPFFSEEDQFFDDQDVRQIYVEVAENIPTAYIYGPYYSQMTGYIATAIQMVATDQMTTQDALIQAANAIRDQTGMP